MTIRTLLSLVCLLSSAILFSQEAKKEADAAKTKMDAFASRTGIITKFTDTELPTLKSTYDPAETRIRKVNSGTATTFFYQIAKKGKYGNSTASIEYSDLVEVLKALTTLKASFEGDVASHPDYLENKFVTEDGFQVGYYVDGSKASWYLKLEKYGSDNTLFIENGDVIQTAFTEAKNRIDELKK